MTIPAVPPGLLAARTSQVLGVFGGRVLDSPAINGSPNAWAPTAYNAEGLIVSAPDPAVAAVLGATLRDLLADHSCLPDGPSWLAGPGETDSPAREVTAGVLATGVRIVPSAGVGAAATPARAPDPWLIVEELRARLGPDVAAAVGLNHLMTSAEQVGGNPLAIGHGRVGLDGYGVTGAGGHGPVTLTLQPPPRPSGGRRPRVVVLDTGIGDHPWFRSDPAETTVRFADGRIVGPDIARSPQRSQSAESDTARIDPLLGSLPTHTGHGTFIAGLLRQSCPDADIVALTVMQANGIVPEHKLIRALDLLVRRQREHPGWADAIVLSLGYYAETGEDLRYTSGLKGILLELGRLGVAVFAAAGNDASRRPSYPAAFAIDPDFGHRELLPVISVAALNPDGTVAPFSNDGPWVTAEAMGVNLVSAAPALPDGGGRPMSATRGPGGRLRSSLDPDNYQGFAVWSGTSFAAPLLAARYLRTLSAAGFPPGTAERRGLLPLGRTAVQNSLLPDRVSPAGVSPAHDFKSSDFHSNDDPTRRRM